MDIINHIVLGLLLVAAGIVAIRYNFQLVGITGNVGFAERYIGAGGTYALFKILAIVAIIGGFLYMTGLIDPVMKALLSPLAGLFRLND